MLEIHQAKRNGQTVLKLQGDLNIYAVDAARRELAAKLEKHPGISLDLSGVTEIDTAGIQLLFWLKGELHRLGQDLPLICHSVAVVEVLDLLNLTGCFGDPILIAPGEV
jgi:anti-sigma B factor antagonist